MENRLLFIYPYERDNPSIPLRYCQYILRRLNYSFKIVEPTKDWCFFYAHFQSMGIDWGDVDIGLVSTLMGIDYLILEIAEFEPDQTIIICGPPLAERIFKFFNKYNIQTILWLVDEFERIKPILPFCNVVFTDKDLAKEGCENIEVVKVKGASLKDQFKEIVISLK